MSEKAKTIREPFFTPKRKKIAAICSAAAVVLWLILWNIFPMEFYSLFFASLVGSNLLLAVLAAVITFPSNLLCSKITRRDISAGIHLIINIVFMVGCIYLYSIFRYDAVWLLIIGIAAHIAVTALLFAKSKAPQVSHIKEPLFGTAKMIAAGVICTILSDCIYYLLFSALLNIFRE